MCLLEDDPISYFGQNVPDSFTINTDEIVHLVNSTGQYLIPNSEIRYNTTLLGFEMYAALTGKIQIDLVSFKFCGQNESCTSHFSINSQFNQTDLKVLSSWQLELKQGYNKFLLPKAISVTKGTLLYLSQNFTGRVVIDTSSSVTFSDYIITKPNTLYNIMKLDPYINWRFVINCLVDLEMYKTTKNFFKTQKFSGLYKVKLNDSVKTIDRIVNLTNCKSLKKKFFFII